MTKKSHNKKRNVGIIYEQLIFTISRGLIEDNPGYTEKAKTIIKRYFKPGTELYREHRLFQALVKPEILDASLATSILKEAKNASRTHDIVQLEREKSRLIRDINLAFGKGFYNQRIKEYKEYATIQTLLNDWRKGKKTKDLERIAIYESKAHAILMKTKPGSSLLEEKNSNIDNLVVKIMTEKFNKKYGSKLNEQQQSLIKQYVFSSKKPEFKSTLESIKEKTLYSLKSYQNECTSEVVKNKITPVLLELKNINTENLNDETLGRFMLLCQLQHELKERKDG